ncbi:hypothetical protein [Vibrio sinaloensis]|uniref:hypothetical protein n=2 Tax=Photobacterium sp. (strain ATCC 43367) TaxID=379097 RepID=UPI002F41926F
MYKSCDFSIDEGQFRFRKDAYPLKRINDIRVKRLTLMDNLAQIVFWVALFSGGLWLAVPDIMLAPLWLQATTGVLTLFGFLFAVLRCSRYALQVEFKHVDETGLQWVNVAKSYAHQDEVLFDAQVSAVKSLTAH